MPPYPEKNYFLLCCFAKAGINDSSGRKALLLLLLQSVCVWVDVWPLSLASSPAPHVTHSLGPNVDQDRKNIKGWFYYSYTNTIYKRTEQQKVDFDSTGILFSLFSNVSANR